MGKRFLNIIGALAATAWLATGCGRDEIKVYRVPKESPAPVEQSAMPPGHPDVGASAMGAAPTSAPPLTWQTPGGWEEVPPGTMRVASFKVTGPNGQAADVSIIPLARSGGDDLSNVNRWRDQVGQSPLSEAELKPLAQPVEVSGQPATLYEQAGDATRILAVIQRRAGTAWFFKMTGSGTFVAQQKPAFIEFLKSIQFAATETGGTPVPPAASNGKPQWAAPAGWQEVPGGQFLVAKFVIAGASAAQAAVNVSASTGDGGGLAANVNRWRKQLGLGEATGEELTKSVTTAGQISFVEMSGAQAALVGAMVRQPGQTWFYKLMGDPAVVAAQKDAFLQFVQEVKY